MTKFLGRTYDPCTDTYKFSDNSGHLITGEQRQFIIELLPVNLESWFKIRSWLRNLWRETE